MARKIINKTNGTIHVPDLPGFELKLNDQYSIKWLLMDCYSEINILTVEDLQILHTDIG